MKTGETFNSYRYGSAARRSATNACVSMKMVMSICCLSLLILILMSSKMSMGQEEPSELQRLNINLNDTESKASQNTAEKIVVSDVLRSATRNQYNNATEQYATVLAPRSDGSIYSGVITFSASEPVRVQIQHPISLDNNTVNSKQLHGIIKYSNKQPISASSIVPNYSNHNFSSSIFFTGKALEITFEKPFVVMYTVSADADKLTNNEGLAKSTNTTRMESLAPPTAYQVNAGTLLTALIPRVSDEYLRELPFSDLDPSQLSLVIVKLPADKAGLILSKIPAGERQEILSKIPADKRQEIMKNLINQ